jgi:hypothetical protein
MARRRGGGEAPSRTAPFGVGEGVELDQLSHHAALPSRSRTKMRGPVLEALGRTPPGSGRHWLVRLPISWSSRRRTEGEDEWQLPSRAFHGGRPSCTFSTDPPVHPAILAGWNCFSSAMGDNRRTITAKEFDTILKSSA